MRRQRQTTFGFPKGNCFAACIASLLDLDVQNVPNFCLDENPNWFTEADRFVANHGFRLLQITGATGITALDGTLFIASGKSPRGDFNHSVITRVEGEQFVVEMDPHPSDDGLDGPFTIMTMLVRAS